jgi:hypothetical protein
VQALYVAPLRRPATADAASESMLLLGFAVRGYSFRFLLLGFAVRGYSFRFRQTARRLTSPPRLLLVRPLNGR